MQSKARVLYTQRALEENGDTRQLQLQLARQDKVVESLRESNRRLELDLRRMVPAAPNPQPCPEPHYTLTQTRSERVHFNEIRQRCSSKKAVRRAAAQQL